MNKQVILGTLLGDGFIPKLRGRAKNYKIRWVHKLAHREYALWKANKLGLKYYIYKRKRYDNRTNKFYSSIIICSKTDKRLKDYYNLFYYRGKKRITQTILNLLSPFAIAIWYCDDGNLHINKYGYHLNLSIDGFTKKERKIIQKYFYKKYGLNFKFCQTRIRLVSKAEIIKFMEYFGEYIPNCMGYKKYE